MKPAAMGIGLAKQFFQVHGINEQARTCLTQVSTQRQLTLQGTYSAPSPASRSLDAAMQIHPHQCVPPPCHDVTTGGHQKK